MPDQSQLTLIIAFASLIMAIIAAAGILFMFFYKRKMTENLRRLGALEEEKKLMIFSASSAAEERERERIAQNLHDEVNAMLAVHKQVLEKHGYEMEATGIDVGKYFREVENIEKIREAVTGCATNLIPAFLLKSGLINALEDHVRQINSTGKVRARFIMIRTGSYIFSRQAEVNVYRICLELISNLVKHASPTAMEFSVSDDEHNLWIKIMHDGKRVSNATMEDHLRNKSGLGLKSIQARALMLNATITYNQAPGSAAIIVKVPFSAENNGHKTG